MIWRSVQQDNAKLLATVPADNISPAQPFLQDARKTLQDLVSGQVPVGVVDFFEMVQIDHGKA